jgi:signal transduction histidine kinase
VEVQDQGVGIDPAHQGVIFEKFSQVGDPLTDKPKGTGLGLAISKDIIEHHGGRIWFESVPGEGTTFSFALPITRYIGELTAQTGPRLFGRSRIL